MEIFTADEKKFMKKLTKVGLIVVVIVAFLSGLAHVLNVYASEGGAGLRRLVAKDDVADVGKGASTLQDSLNQTIGAQINTGELPLFLEVPSIGVQSAIESPTLVTVPVLDAALNRGPVYYPGSGSPGERNMLIFGHSTGFRIVRNKAYQVFNDIKKVQPGAYVYVRTSSGVHTYKTLQVKRVSKYNTWVQFNSPKPMLTLATCDSFGKASDRWVLEAEYVGFEKR